ncbi:MAG TPA: uracil-DNA glycosylase [Spirochaetales bacterium]|nr:uracil-DNA glycosylase [Spirochaetales bacterium]
MSTQNSLNDLVKLFNLIEDYYEEGFHRRHSDVELAEQMAGPEDQFLEINNEISSCRKCGLFKERNNTVPGEGVINPLVMLIGEGPGADEDRTGKPFVGRAGKYLDSWLMAIDLDRRKNCFIGNIVKCRPPDNRDPLPEESSACLPYLQRQISFIRPKAIMTLGRIATQILTGEKSGIGALRGRIYSYQGIPLAPTYHPSAVLRNISLRASVWQDLQKLRSVLQNG